MSAENPASPRPPQLSFERHEVKYLVDDSQRQALNRTLQAYLRPDEHGPATNRSVYYDTPSLVLARRSAEHPRYKEKIRIRSYGCPREDAPVFVELKKKCAGIVYKRRCQLALTDAKLLLAGSLPPSTQIERELAYAAGRYEGLTPMVYLAYDREAFYGIQDRGLRLTLDRCVRMRWQEPRLDGPDAGTQILPDGLSILEVKALGCMPFWLVRALAKITARPASWSKYATACRLHLAQEPCAIASDGRQAKGDITGHTQSERLLSLPSIA